MSQVHSSHSPKSPVRSIVPHMIPQSSGASSARPVAAGHSAGSNYSGSATVASSWNAQVARPAYAAAPGTRRKSSGETLEALLPFAKWGVAVLLLILGGFGISKLVAGSRSQHQVETHAIQVKALLGGKPMPGASMTLTPILSPSRRQLSMATCPPACNWWGGLCWDRTVSGHRDSLPTSRVCLLVNTSLH